MLWECWTLKGNNEHRRECVRFCVYLRLSLLHWKRIHCVVFMLVYSAKRANKLLVCLAVELHRLVETSWCLFDTGTLYWGSRWAGQHDAKHARQDIVALLSLVPQQWFLNHRPQRQRKKSVCLSSSAFPQARDDRKVVRSLVIDSFCRKLTHCRHVWGWYQ